MENLGEYIKKEREKKGITLEEAAKATRISRTSLAAIEEGNFSIQSPVFMKGFLRSYAEFLGLDSAEILERYTGILEEREGKGGAEEHKLEPVPRKYATKALITLSLIAVIIVATIFITMEPEVAPPAVKPAQEAKLDQQEAAMVNITAFGTITSTKGKFFQTVTTSAKPAKPSAEPTKPSPEPTKPASEPQKPAVSVVPKPEGPAKRYTLKVTAKEMTWLKITVDDKPPVEALLRSGETVSWTADNKFVLTAGNAGGIDLTLNGKPLEGLGETGQVVTKTIPE